MITKLIDYLKGTRVEFKHVNWPTKKQAMNFTLIVIIVSLIIAFMLGLFDFIFSLLLNKYII